MQKLEIDATSWTELNRLLDQALDLPAPDRDPWFDALSPEFAALKPRLRSLLSRAALVETGDLFNTLPKLDLKPGELSDAPARAERPGEEIGPYRLVRELGSGGMGVVWLAERTDGLIARPVALKLPHGAWRRAGLAERMAREREILASLAHPNIAHLYDAGVTADGQPYLAIEYVEGSRIDAYCQERGLDVPARLRLFAQVAAAVAYAHGKLVVHRDLKPANVLVTAGGQARLLDFGIAKLLEEGQAKETRFTELSGRALTPDYASPEQIVGAPLTVASDVYSLGVILYELLCDRRPYKLQRDSRGALEDAILQAEPPLPSSVNESRRKALRGDLDTVVLKALKKKPDDRYPTAHALLEDIERHLASRPVLAQPDSRWYRLRKFVKRNKIAVGASASIACAIMAGAGVAIWQARVANAQSQRAERVKNFIVAIFSDADPIQTGSPTIPSAVELLHLATKRLDALADVPPEVRIELRDVIGGSLLSLDDAKSAEVTLRAAVAESGATLGPGHPRTVHARRLLAQALHSLNQLAPAQAELDAILPLLRQRGAQDPAELVAGLYAATRTAARQRRHEDAITLTNEALGTMRTRLGDRSLEIELLLSLTSSYRQLGQLAASNEASFAAYAAAQEIHPGEPRHPKVVETRLYNAGALSKVGRPAQAVEQYRSVFQDTEILFGPKGRALGLRLSSTARDFSDAGFIDEAMRNARRARDILLEPFPQGNARLDAATAENIGLVANAGRDAETALHWLAISVEGFRREYGATDETAMDVQRMRSLALSYAGRIAEAGQAMSEVLAHHPRNQRDQFDVVAWVSGVRQRFNGDPQAALRLEQTAFESLPPHHLDTLDSARIQTEIALDRIELGEIDGARASITAAIAIFERRQVEMTPDHAEALVALGRIGMSGGAPGSALTHLSRADSFWRAFRPSSRWAGETALWLGRCHRALGHGAQADEALRRARALLDASPMPADIELAKLAREG